MTPHRSQVSPGDKADHRISRPQLPIEPLLPGLPHRQAMVRIAIQKWDVAFALQPETHFVSQHTVGAGMADEDGGHRLLPVAARSRQDLTRCYLKPLVSTGDRAFSPRPRQRTPS